MSAERCMKYGQLLFSFQFRNKCFPESVSKHETESMAVWERFTWGLGYIQYFWQANACSMICKKRCTKCCMDKFQQSLFLSAWQYFVQIGD